MRETLSNVISLIPPKYAVIAGIALAITAVILIIKAIVDFIMDRSKAKKYIIAFDEGYRDENVLEALRNTLQVFPEKRFLFFHKIPIERRAIIRAIDYLDESILRDYQTAFSFIEGCIPNKNVREKHEEVLEIETSKKNGILKIADKNMRTDSET